MAIINVQSSSAAGVLDTRPGHAKGALAAITDASRCVLDKLNAMVRFIRDHGQPAERVPTPGLADVANLVEAENSREDIYSGSHIGVRPDWTVSWTYLRAD